MKAVSWMMDQRLKLLLLQNTSMWKQPVFDHLKYVSEKFAIKKSSIYIVTLMDLNTPYARSKARVKHMSAATSTLNAEHGARSVNVTWLTDIPVKGALKADLSSVTKACTHTRT